MFFGNLILNLNLKSALKKLKLNELLLENSSKTSKS